MVGLIHHQNMHSQYSEVLPIRPLPGPSQNGLKWQKLV